jgi:hypothetical protein
MSKSYIIATDDIRTGTWNIRTENLKPFQSQLLIGFTGEPPVVTFDNLSFGYELRDSSSSTISQGSFPREGQNYVNTEADEAQWIESINLITIPETDYNLHMWCVNGGNRFEKDFTFTTPRPTQPFVSWTYDSETYKWNPPVEYPNDGELYLWNEDTQSWDVDTGE